MGYFKNLKLNEEMLVFALFAFGVALSIVVIILMSYLFIRKNKNRWKANMNMDLMLTKQKSTLDKLINDIEKQADKSKLKINAKVLTVVLLMLSVLSFVLTLSHFKNLTAAVLIAFTVYSVPDYIFFVLYNNLNKKIEDQIVVGIRIFTAEYIKSKNLEKSIVETSKRVQDPVGTYFAQAYEDMLMGYPIESVISRMANKSHNEYWQIFSQLLHQLRIDSTVITLFTDLVVRVERNIELTRHNDSTLTSERTLGLIMSLTPLPAYFFMRHVVPETTYFVTQTTIGQFILIFSFSATLIFLYVDKFSRKHG